MTSTVSELLRITKDILNYCLSEEPSKLKSLSEQRCDEKWVQQCSVKAVYNIILELASDSLRMIEEKRYVSSATLLRSLVEYFMELLFLAKHPSNYKQREQDAKREQQKILNAIENSKDPALAKFKTDSKFEPRKSELKDDLKDYTSKTIWGLCDEVGYKWMYDMVYRCLSPVAHPSIVNYNNRYFKADSSGRSVKYNPAPQLDKESAIQRLILLSNILINSTGSIHHLLPDCDASVVDAQLEKFVCELKRLDESSKAGVKFASGEP
jgi:hypothetical protein